VNGRTSEDLWRVGTKGRGDEGIRGSGDVGIRGPSCLDTISIQVPPHDSILDYGRGKAMEDMEEYVSICL
jgi:hypothetical protein